jgi:transcriptional regulator with XRE-family HTH domain
MMSNGAGIIMHMSEFFSWMNSELEDRGWSYNELARRAGFSSGTVSMVMTGKNQVSWEFCAGVADAFGMPPEDVFRKAGLLRPTPDPEGVQELTRLAKGLDAHGLELLTEFAQFLYQKERQNRPGD